MLHYNVVGCYIIVYPGGASEGSEKVGLFARNHRVSHQLLQRHGLRGVGRPDAEDVGDGGRDFRGFDLTVDALRLQAVA